MLAFFAFCLPLLGILSPHGTIYPLIASSVISYIRARKHPITHSIDFSFSFIKLKLISRVFLFWIFLSCLWAPFTGKSFVIFLKVFAITTATALWFSHIKRHNIIEILCKFLFISSLIVCIFGIIDNVFHLKLIEHFRHVGAAKAYTQATIVLLLNYWVVLPWLMKKNQKLLLLLYVLCHFLLFNMVDCLTVSVGFILSHIGYALFSVRPNMSYKTLRSLLIFSMLTAPLIGLFFTQERVWDINQHIRDESAIHRLHIWHSISERVIKAPFAGYGLDSSRDRKHFETPTPHVILDANNQINAYDAPPVLCMHPHNFILQIWYELGFIGVLLCMAGLLTLLKYIVSFEDKIQKTCAMGLYLSMLSVGAFSVGVWQSWWLATLGYLFPILLIMHTQQRAQNTLEAEYEIISE